jgi:hypothetical protein
VARSAVTAVQLSAFTGDITNPGQHVHGTLEQRVGRGGGELAQPRSGHEATVGVAHQQPVDLQGYGQPMGGRSRDACSLDEI